MKKTNKHACIIAVFIAIVLFLPALSLHAGGRVWREKLDECEDEKSTLQEENADLKTQLDSMKSEIDKLQEDKRDFEAEKAELERKIAEYEELVAYWQSEIERYGFEPEDPSVISKTVSESLRKRDAKIVELEADVEEMEKEIEEMEKEIEEMKNELEQVNLQLDIAKRKLEAAEKEAEQLRIEMTLYERKVRDLEEENEELLSTLEIYEGITEETAILMDIALDRIRYVLRDEIRRGEVRVFKGTLGITLDVVSAHMFETGSVELTPQGRKILGKIAGLLEELDGYLIGVIGNADRRPIITPALKAKYPTNWELSSHRGASVVRFLLEEANVDPRTLVAMGLGEYQPIDRARTEEGYGNNRRIDIVLLPIDALAAIVIGAEIK
jgi:chemotaxis protein MotB